MVDESHGNDLTRATPGLPLGDVTLDSRSLTLGSREPFLPRSPANGQFQPGDIIDGRYQVISVIGSGGHGSVYRVHQILLKKDFALKTLNPVSMSEVTMLRLRKEAQAASRLDHPNLVQAVDFGMIDSMQPFLVMDLVEGPTLAEYLKAHGRLTVEKALEIFLPLAKAVAYAHERGVVHRDLKPSNVILASDRSRTVEFLPRIVDFGIAKIRFADESHALSLTGTGDVFGTPLYMSPEQCAGLAVDSRSDIYSLGCMLFEALTGSPPYNGRNPLEVMMAHGSAKLPTLKEGSFGETFPAELERIVASMLAKLPDERYSNSQKVADDLFFLQRGDFDRISTIAQTGAVTLRHDDKRQNLLFIIGGAIACLTIGGAISYLVVTANQPVPNEATARPAVPELSTMLSGDVEDAFISRTSPESSQVTFAFPLIPVTDKSGNQVQTAGVNRPHGKTISEWLDAQEHVPYWGDFCWWGSQKPGDSKLEELTIAINGKPFGLPKTSKLILNAGMSLIQHPYLWGRFRSTDLFGIVISKNACSMNESTVNQCIYSLAFQDKLRIVTLDTLTMSPRAVRSIGGLSSVQWLDLSHIWITKEDGNSSAYTGRDVAGLSILPQLRVLRLEQCLDVTPVLQTLSKGDNLRRLSLANDKCTDEDMVLIGQLKKLEILDIRGSDVDGNKLIAALSDLKHLKKLVVDLTVLEKMNPEHLAALKNLVEVVPVHSKKQTPTQEIMENIGRCIVEIEKPSEDLFNCLSNDPSQVGL